MKSLLLFLAITSLSAGLTACKSNDVSPQTSTPPTNSSPPQTTNLLLNGDVELMSQSWFFNYSLTPTTNPNGFAHGHTNEAAASPVYSLKINCNTVKNDSAFCYYGQSSIPVDNIPVGAKLTLTAKIKTVNLVGSGVSIAIRGDNGQQVAFFRTTQGKTRINGTNDFKQYSVTLDSYPGNIDNLLIFMVYLPQTTGAVYFDDLSLTVSQ